MEVLKSTHINKTSIILKRNSKKQGYTIHNLKQGLKSNDTKNKHLLNNIQNKVKEIPLLNKKNKQNQIKKNNKEINNKDLLTNNLLIRAFSYKKIEENDKKVKSIKKLPVNKKVKNNMLEYKVNNNLTIVI